jgi:hypothetical protein
MVRSVQGRGGSSELTLHQHSGKPWATLHQGNSPDCRGCHKASTIRPVPCIRVEPVSRGLIFASAAQSFADVPGPEFSHPCQIKEDALFLILLTLLSWFHSRPEPSPRVRVDYDRRADVSFYLGELDNMTIHPDHLMCMGWMVDGPRPEGIRDYELALRVWGITSLIGGDQYSLVLKDVPAAWIRENFSRGLLAGGWISRPEGIQLPAAVMIMSSQRTIVCVDTLNIIGPVSSDWDITEQAVERLTEPGDVHLVFNRLQSIDELCTVQTRKRIRMFQPNQYGIGYNELE